MPEPHRLTGPVCRWRTRGASCGAGAVISPPIQPVGGCRPCARITGRSRRSSCQGDQQYDRHAAAIGCDPALRSPRSSGDSRIAACERITAHRCGAGFAGTTGWPASRHGPRMPSFRIAPLDIGQVSTVPIIRVGTDHAHYREHAILQTVTEEVRWRQSRRCR